MTTVPPVPFYLDWTFWTALLALAAIILSQLPPLHLLLRPKRLDVEVHSRIGITHKVGNPNVNVVVSVRNTGGRELRVRALRLNVSLDGTPLFVLPVQNYFETHSSSSSVLFVPFSLKPGETWAHSVSFLNLFDRLTEKSFRENLSALGADIRRQIESRLPDQEKQVVFADPALVKPFNELFERLFKWQSGEYIAELQVDAEPGSASYSKKYRFTLFESDTVELRAHVEDYRTGGGLTFNLEKHAGVRVPLSEHVS